jgi:DnaJ like chaperone protein
MAYVYYRRSEGPGCGGCLLIFLLLAFLTGGAPALFRVLGVLVYGALFFFIAVAAAIWGTTWFLRRKVSEYERSQTDAHNEYVSLLVHILVKVAKHDGTVSREEVATIRRFFQVRLRYSQSQLLWVRDIIKEAMESEVPLEDLLGQVRARFAYEPRLLLLEMVYGTIYSKGAPAPGELELARRIGQLLQISPFDQRIIEMRFTGGYGPAAAAGRDADKERRSLELLGLEKGAPFSEIKAAYRKLSMQHHPDKVRHLGEEFRKVAEEKMKEINEAYDFLEKKYGA